MGELKAINVVPHFMRLHEWVALEEGHFQAEGLEPRILDDVMHQVSSHGADQYFERPQDAPFVKAEEVANSACEWARSATPARAWASLCPTSMAWHGSPSSSARGPGLRASQTR